MLSFLRVGIGAIAAGALVGVGIPAAAETQGSLASAGEVAALAAAYRDGALGSGKCAWVHPVTGGPTTIPCELLPLQLLMQMARNPANKQAQFELGKRYEEGRGLTPDLKMARKYYRMAARDLTQGRPVLMPGRDPSALSFGEFGHGGTLIEAGYNRPRMPGYVAAVGLPEARERLKQLAD